MSEYRNFKLLVRAVGLMLTGLAAPSAVYVLLGIWNIAVSPSPSTMASQWGQWLLSVGGSWLQLAFGLYLTFYADRLIHYFIREVRDNCLRCGYDLKTLSTNVCPECGEVVELPPRPVAALPSPDRSSIATQSSPQGPETPKNQG